MKIVTVVGARPQFIKEASFSRAIKDRHKEILIHTGQHYDYGMSDVFFEELNISKPDYNLGISGGTHGSMTGRMIEGIEGVLIKEKPDLAVVFGDTNSTLAASIAAVKLHIPIAHIEAGGRVGTLDNPEEANRIATDHFSKFLFAVSETERANLVKEGLGDRAFVVGNIMLDSFLYYGGMNTKTILNSIEGDKVIIPERFYYLTCHRQENTQDDNALCQIFDAMEKMPYPTIYPVHPRNLYRASRIVKNNNYSNVRLVRPVGYLESVWLTNHCEAVITDSGGLQTEAFFSKKKCVTIFDKVVWPQTLDGCRNQYCKPVAKDIVNALNTKQIIDDSYKPFGDGHASERIIKIIEDGFRL